MHKVRVISGFNSAHNLRGYKGKCEALHGHNWRVEAAASSESLDGAGMVIDFKLLKDDLKQILSDLDHKYLNEIEYFKTNNPTSENIARYVYGKLKEKCPSAHIDSVTVWETDTSAATYSE